MSPDATLEATARVVAALREEGVPCVLIGAVALAVHGYVRHTEDVDLAVAIEPRRLRDLARRLEALRMSTNVREPDGDDPLGGVLDIRAPGADLIQVVNFSNPPAGGFPRVVGDAVKASSELEPGSSIRVADPYHLVAFKLYAGGPKSKLDILALLESNPDLDRSRLASLCKGYHLERELANVLALEDEPADS